MHTEAVVPVTSNNYAKNIFACNDKIHAQFR